MTTADTPDIVERLKGVEESQDYHASARIIREASETILGLRAQLSPMGSRRPLSLVDQALVHEAQRLLHRYSTNESAWRRVVEGLLDSLGEPSAPSSLLEAEAADTILALRAAQSPQARDEGEAVEGWMMAPREPDKAMLAGGAAMCDEKTPEEDTERARMVWWGMVSAAPSPPTDAINTAEGEAGLAQKEPAGRTDPEPDSQRVSGASARNAEGGAGAAGESPHSIPGGSYAEGQRVFPPQAPQDVAKANDNPERLDEVNVVRDLFDAKRWLVEVIEAEDGLVLQSEFYGSKAEERARHYAYLLRRGRLAAALTPRELTDEEAERGARAYHERRREGRPAWQTWEDACKVEGWLAEQIIYIRAAYRAITEEPAR